MKIRIKGDRLVAPDGIHLETWRDGSVHEFADEHALSMIAAGHAEAVVGPSETKVVEPDEPAPKKKRGG
jgi:hypothetical protein